MIGLVLLGALVLGAGYSNVKSRIEDRRFPPPGALVDVGGRRMHLHCEGEGGTTVILDAGAGTWSSSMGRIQRALKDSARVCSYDRAGLGWSDGSNAGKDVGASADDLRLLVESASIPRPFVLAGHSLGANIAQVYASRYPGDLAGVVLLDPGRHDDMMEDYSAGDSAAMKIDGCGWKCGLASTVSWLGVPRLAARNAGRKNLSPEEAEVYRAGIMKPRTTSTIIATLQYLPKSAVQTRTARGFGTVPVTILYSENTRPPSGDETEADVRTWHAATLDSMRAILSGTSKPRGPVIVPAVNHTTMILDPAAVRLIASEILMLTR